MQGQHTSWRCPACGAVVTTHPQKHAYCTGEDCLFVAMEPHTDTPWRADFTGALLSFPHLTPEQHRLDHEMRANRGVLGT